MLSNSLQHCHHQYDETLLRHLRVPKLQIYLLNSSNLLIVLFFGLILANPNCARTPSLLDSVKDLPERRSVALIGSVFNDSSSNSKFLNSFDKLQRVFANIFRFISNCRAKSAPLKGRLSVDEINSGTVLLLRSIQQVNLAKEYGPLSQGKPFPQKSTLVSLRPILGSDGLLRVGGRL